MKYMMFVVADPNAAAEAEPSGDDLTIEQWLADVDSRGKRITGDALRPVSEAKTVSVRGESTARVSPAGPRIGEVTTGRPGPAPSRMRLSPAGLGPWRRAWPWSG
jgi:hypothetical protein